MVIANGYYHRKKACYICLFLNFFLIINRSISARPGPTVTFKCLYNAVILSRFTFCLYCRVEVASVVSGSVNDVSSTLLVFGVIIIIFILNKWNGFFINKSRIIHLIFSEHFPFLAVLNKHKK